MHLPSPHENIQGSQVVLRLQFASSEASGQSLSESHLHCIGMQAPVEPHRNSSSLHVVFVAFMRPQSRSSDPSRQSFSLSHTHFFEIHRLLSHVNSLSLHFVALHDNSSDPSLQSFSCDREKYGLLIKCCGIVNKDINRIKQGTISTVQI